MKYVITIDIGNTNITAGVFRNGELIDRTKVSTHTYSIHDRHFNALIKKCKDRHGDIDIVITSVVPIALSRILVSLNKIGKHRILIVGKDLAVPIKNLYRNRKEVGQDRLVNAYAAREFYGKPCVVVDFGTAITFDIVSKRGEYLGGLILPGIEMGLKSLHAKTAMLPKIELEHAEHIIGKDTVNSMRGGILFGYGAMCDGLAEKYRKILGSKTRIIATGGNASLIKHYSSSIQAVDEDLTLKGLYLIAKS